MSSLVVNIHEMGFTETFSFLENGSNNFPNFPVVTVNRWLLNIFENFPSPASKHTKGPFYVALLTAVCNWISSPMMPKKSWIKLPSFETFQNLVKWDGHGGE